MVRRSNNDPTSSAGHDSFLDIVANIVGILIILVVVTGVRVKQLDFQERPISEEMRETAKELYEQQATVASMRGRLDDTFRVIEEVKLQTTFRAAEREQLATAVSLAKSEIDNRRSGLSVDEAREFDTRLALDAARIELKDLQQKLAYASQPEEESTMIVENYPTPLSETVEGKEFHFQLRDRRIAYIPLESLVERFTKDAQGKLYQMQEQRELSDTVGPDGGFRLRYVIERYDIAQEEAMATGHGGSRVRLKQWTLIPASNSLGDPVDEALLEGSEFRSQMKKMPSDAVLTVWTYADSFDEYRRLVKAVYHEGYACAARPLRAGEPISASPNGTKSAAQ